MRKGMGNRGFVKVIIIMLLLAGMGYVGMSFGKPYYRFNTLRSHTKDILLEESSGNVASIRTKIMETAAELKVPLDEKDLEVTVTPTRLIKVKATWSEVVDLYGYYQKKLDFVMETEY